MDKKTKVFNRISAGIPKRLAANTTKEIVDTSQLERAHDVLESRSVPASEKRRIKKLLDQGAFTVSETVENEAVTKEIEKHNERAVAAAIASGELPDPAKDPFVQSRMQRLKNGRPTPKVKGIVWPTQDRILVRAIDMAPKSSIIIVPDSSKKSKPIITGLVVGIGKQVVDESLLGKRVGMQGYDYDVVESNGEMLYLTREANILFLIDPDFKDTIE